MSNITILSTEIRQHGELFSLNDFHKAAGGSPKHRPNQFVRLDQTQALIAEIENAQISAIKTIRGLQGGTYACRELVIAYAAWISAAFHLKVIRVFLDAQKVEASIDAQTMLLDGHFDLAVALPSELTEAIDRKAWWMAGEAHQLFREYLTRIVARHQCGAPGREYINANRALETIGNTTIGNALTHRYHSEIKVAKSHLDFIMKNVEHVRDSIQAVQKANGGKP